MTVVAIGLSYLSIKGVQHCSSPSEIYRFSPSLVLINLDHHDNQELGIQLKSEKRLGECQVWGVLSKSLRRKMTMLLFSNAPLDFYVHQNALQGHLKEFLPDTNREEVEKLQKELQAFKHQEKNLENKNSFIKQYIFNIQRKGA